MENIYKNLDDQGVLNLVFKELLKPHIGDEGTWKLFYELAYRFKAKIDCK